jgi:hypothetical protein
MTKMQIRDAVFETNSSSSHSVTIDREEVVDLQLQKETLRDGVIRVELHHDGYGWEWYRYYKPENKIAYMVTQFAGGHLPSGCSDLSASDDHVALFREDTRCDWFLRTIEEASGCRVEITRSSEDTDWGYGINHQSVGRDIEEISDEADILKLVFGRNSYVETGNDNDYPPEKIQTDVGAPVQYFERILVSHMPDGIQFRLRENNGEGGYKNIELRTLSDGCLSTPDVTWPFRKKLQELIAEGDVVVGGFHVWLPYHDDAPDSQVAAFARRVAYEKHIDLFRGAKNMRVVRDFEVTFDLKPYVQDDDRRRSSPGIHDFMRQAEVTLLATSRDDTVDRLIELVADAENYAPKKEPTA